jgi:hypothetical protein
MPAYWGKTKEDPHLQFDGTLLCARKGQATRKIRSRVPRGAAYSRSDGKTRYAIAQVRDKAMQRSPLHCICPCVPSIYLPGIRRILLTALGSNYTASKYTWKGCAVENLASESPLRKFKVCYWDSYLDFGSSDADLFDNPIIFGGTGPQLCRASRRWIR